MERILKFILLGYALSLSAGCAQYVALEAAGAAYRVMTDENPKTVAPNSSSQSRAGSRDAIALANDRLVCARATESVNRHEGLFG